MKSFRLLPVIPLLAGCLALAAACGARTVGSGNLATETRAVSGFHAVEFVCPGTLDITQGDKEELVVEAEDNILPLIESRVKPDGVLLITFKEHDELKTTKPLSFKLSAKTLDNIVLVGSGNIHVGGKLSAENESIKLPGSGNVTLDDLATGTLKVSLEGSGAIKVNGAASSQSVVLDGSGSYEAGSFKTTSTKVSVNGSGESEVWAEKNLELSIAGSGEVKYYGHPELKQRVTGSGEVRALGEKGS